MCTPVHFGINQDPNLEIIASGSYLYASTCPCLVNVSQFIQFMSVHCQFTIIHLSTLSIYDNSCQCNFSLWQFMSVHCQFTIIHLSAFVSLRQFISVHCQFTQLLSVHCQFTTIHVSALSLYDNSCHTAETATRMSDLPQKNPNKTKNSLKKQQCRSFA